MAKRICSRKALKALFGGKGEANWRDKDLWGIKRGKGEAGGHTTSAKECITDASPPKSSEPTDEEALSFWKYETEGFADKRLGTLARHFYNLGKKNTEKRLFQEWDYWRCHYAIMNTELEHMKRDGAYERGRQSRQIELADMSAKIADLETTCNSVALALDEKVKKVADLERQLAGLQSILKVKNGQLSTMEEERYALIHQKAAEKQQPTCKCFSFHKENKKCLCKCHWKNGEKWEAEVAAEKQQPCQSEAYLGFLEEQKLMADKVEITNSNALFDRIIEEYKTTHQPRPADGKKEE